MTESQRSEEYPEQREDLLNKRVIVTFRNDLSTLTEGAIIRADKGNPPVLLIKLKDDRVIKGSDCQYALIERKPFPWPFLVMAVPIATTVNILAPNSNFLEKMAVVLPLSLVIIILMTWAIEQNRLKPKK